MHFGGIGYHGNLLVCFGFWCVLCQLLYVGTLGQDWNVQVESVSAVSQQIKSDDKFQANRPCFLCWYMVDFYPTARVVTQATSAHQTQCHGTLYISYILPTVFMHMSW